MARRYRLDRTTNRYDIKQWHPSLESIGIAVEYYPHYVNRKADLHTVDVVLLSLIIKGHGRHLMDDKVYRDTGSSLTITHYNEKHVIVTGAEGMEIFNVYLDMNHHILPSLPAGLRPVLPLLLPLHPRFQHRLNRIVRLKVGDTRPLVNLLFAIERELRRREAGYEESVMLLWKFFLILCCRRVIQQGFVPQTGPAHLPWRRLEELRQYLDQAYGGRHTLQSLAQRTKVSPTYLCRSFKAYTGKTLFDYLIERRIQAAMINLRSTDEKVLTIALESGFRDLAYFNRKLKQIVGMTPTAYRRGENPGQSQSN